MDSVLAGHEQPADAVVAHVAERHRVGGCVILAIPQAKKRIGNRERNQEPVIGSLEGNPL